MTNPVDNDFLPEDYTPPQKENKYLNKFPQGETRFRILSKPIIGWLDWDDKKPCRYRMEERPEKSVDPNGFRHFWAAVIWNYTLSKIQIMEITQATIQKKIAILSQDTDWGNPLNYDIKITRVGESMQDTKYDVTAIPHKPVAPDVVDMCNKTPINLAALFEGEDPFSEAKEVAAQKGKVKMPAGM